MRKILSGMVRKYDRKVLSVLQDVGGSASFTRDMNTFTIGGFGEIGWCPPPWYTTCDEYNAGAEINVRRGERIGAMDLRDRWVHFRICDVYHPDPTQVLIDLHGNDVLSGKVIDLSDSGKQENAFIEVEVQGLRQAVIVPVERILEVL
jgi:hypothetical protein